MLASCSSKILSIVSSHFFSVWLVCLFVCLLQPGKTPSGEKGDVNRSRAPVEIQQHLNANAVTLVGLFASAGSIGTHTVPDEAAEVCSRELLINKHLTTPCFKKFFFTQNAEFNCGTFIHEY